MKKFYYLLLLLGMMPFIAFSQSKKPYMPDPDAQMPNLNIDVIHQFLDVHFVPKEGLVIGTVTDSFKPVNKKTDSFFIDGPGIRFKSVKINGKTAPYSQTDKGIYIKSPKKLKSSKTYILEMSYEANPRRGIYFIGWDDSTNRSRKQIWTQGEMDDNRYWIPSQDNRNDKLITEVVVNVDNKFKALSNGSLLEKKDVGDGTTNWHYRISHPHASYLFMLGIGDYNIQDDRSGSGVPLHYWYYPQAPEKLEPTYRYTPKIMDFFEQTIGIPYPWKTYSQIPVQNFIYGAMENTTATIFGDFYYIDAREFLDRRYVGVNAHEMAHQWFGDLITSKTDADQWLQEGFATHYAKLAERHIFGDNYFQWNRRGEQNTALTASEKKLIPIGHTKGGTARIYQKASFVLDMLKDTVGEENFNKVVKAYLEKYAFSNVNSADFEAMFKKVLGMDMHWFFDEWIYRASEPYYSVKYNSELVNGIPTVVVSIKQKQALDSFTDLIAMPIKVQVFFADGTSTWKKEFVSDESHKINIPNPNSKPIDFVLFDPGNHILKKVDFFKGMEELQAQAAKAPEMIDRYDAIEAMKNFGYHLKRDFMNKLFATNPYYPIQEEIIAQIANDAHATSQATILMAIKDDNASVRRKAVESMEQIPESMRKDFEKLLTDSSYETISAALVKLVDNFPDRKQEYLKLTDGQTGLAMGTRITWLKIAANDPDEKYYAELVDYATPAFEFRTRLIAFKALDEIDLWNEKAFLSALEAASSWNNRLAGPVKEIIINLKRNGYKAKIQAAYNKGNWSEAQKSILKDLIK